MPSRRSKSNIDLEVDLHGHTAAEARVLLERGWPEWRGMRCVRIVFGRGDVLRPAVGKWCSEMGIPFEAEANNPGSGLIYPRRRQMPDVELKTYLRDKGLTLTPQEEEYLRDPAAAQKARAEALAKRQAEERKKQSDAATQLLKKRQDEALWRAEVARLDGIEKRRTGKTESDLKPSGPVVRPPSEMKHQEGWWKAELVRVADTDTDTLKKQKRTGLDKLAPPVVAEKPARQVQGPSRDEEADRRLFEDELRRLGEGGL